MTDAVTCTETTLQDRHKRRRDWTAAERGRAARLRADVLARRLVLRWVAGAIGRSVSTLQQALLGYRAASVTLDRVETLLGAIDAGQVVPVTHPERPAALVDTLTVAPALAAVAS